MVFCVAAISLISTAALVVISFLVNADVVLQFEFVRKYRLFLLLSIYIFPKSMGPSETTLASNTIRRGAARRDAVRPETSSSVESEGLDVTIVHNQEFESISFVRVSRD